MKKWLHFFMLIGIAIGINSCKKNNSSPTYTISGTFYTDCSSMTPISGASLKLCTNNSTTFGPATGGILNTTHTDVNGKFTFTYSAVPDYSNIEIWNDKGGYQLIGIPLNQSISDADIYLRDTSHILLFLNAQKAYTSNDTLFWALGNHGSFLIGPFPSYGLIDQINTRSVTYHYCTKVKDTARPEPDYSLIWSIGSNGTLNDLTGPLLNCLHSDSLVIGLQ